MPDSLVVAVGGTGQLVLELYTQLWLVGTIKSPFTALLIDTDAVNKPLKQLLEFLEAARNAADQLGLEGYIPHVEIVQLTVQQTSVAELLAGYPPDQVPQTHALRAFFAEDLLRQDIRSGCFARPALTAILEKEYASRLSAMGGSATHAVVVGSLIGGTGAGLIPQLLGLLEDPSQQGPQFVGAVLVEEWFEPDDGVIQDVRARFDSNKKAALRVIRDRCPELWRYAVVQPRGERRDRNQVEEKTVTHRPWPDRREDWRWQSVQYLHYLLNETASDLKQDFADRELEQVPDAPAVKSAKRSLETALRRAGALVNYQILKRVGADPLARYIWGEGLVAFIAGWWRNTAQARPDTSSLVDFLRGAQAKTDSMWNACLKPSFPNLPVRSRPADIATLNWPEVPKQVKDTERLAGSEVGEEWLAAALLLGALRGGLTHGTT